MERENLNQDDCRLDKGQEKHLSEQIQRNNIALG